MGLRAVVGIPPAAGDTRIALEHGTPPTAPALGIKVELWTEDDIRLGHGFEWIAEDASDEEVRRAVRQLGVKLRRMLDAHRAPKAPELKVVR